MDTGKCIVNMINCRPGEHCLFRSFGLGGVVDQIGRLRKSQVTQELARWYPNVKLTKFEIENGEYNVRTEGV